MKKLSIFLIFALLVLGLCLSLFAAGTVTWTMVPSQPGPSNSTEVITWVCTADSSNNFPVLGATGLASPTVRGWVYAVDAWGGTPAPTSGTSLSLVSSDLNRDALAGKGSGYVTTATPAQIVPAAWINVGTLSPVLTDNSVSGAQVYVRASIWRQPN